MNKIELLLPAGNVDCLRAAVNNGADAVYIGLSKFNARSSAENFSIKNIFSAVDYCHKRKVKVYVTLNTLVKNKEMEDFLEQASLAYQAKADALIIQDVCLVPILKKNFPKMKLHLSTQATVTNSYSVPEGVDRVILARELSIDEIKKISEKYETEIFTHGALCFSYSGQCLFSSLAGGRSGNRGCCAQPCRMRYNNKYLLSTMDLCLLERLPEAIASGVKSLKVEGRLRSPIYVGTVARVYRKYIDMCYAKNFKIDEKDIDDLKLAFNREFTSGFAFNDSITDTRQPMNRGLYLGNVKDKKLKLLKDVKIGDGIAIWREEKIVGHKITALSVNGKKVGSAKAGEEIDIDEGDYPIYKTSSVDMKINIGEELQLIIGKIDKKVIDIPRFKRYVPETKMQMIVKCYNKNSAIIANKAKAEIIYYDILKDDVEEVKKSIDKAKFFLFTPRILSDDDIILMEKLIDRYNPDGLQIANRGLLYHLKGKFKGDIHLDYSLNCFNDIDVDYYTKLGAIPTLSLELNFKEFEEVMNRNVIMMIHGDIVLMTTKQKMAAPELVDDEGRHFRIRRQHNYNEILNSKQLGLFSKSMKYARAGIKYFLIDCEKDAGKFIIIYKKILSGQKFDDAKIRKGYTTGHFERGVV